MVQNTITANTKLFSMKLKITHTVIQLIQTTM